TLFHETASSNGQAIDILDRRSEDYLDRAIRKWLPAAFPIAAVSSSKRPIHGDRIQDVSFSESLTKVSQSPGPQTRGSPQLLLEERRVGKVGWSRWSS